MMSVLWTLRTYSMMLRVVWTLWTYSDDCWCRTTATWSCSVCCVSVTVCQSLTIRPILQNYRYLELLSVLCVCDGVSIADNQTYITELPLPGAAQCAVCLWRCVNRWQSDLYYRTTATWSYSVCCVSVTVCQSLTIRPILRKLGSSEEMRFLMVTYLSTYCSLNGDISVGALFLWWWHICLRIVLLMVTYLSAYCSLSGDISVSVLFLWWWNICLRIVLIIVTYLSSYCSLNGDISVSVLFLWWWHICLRIVLLMVINLSAYSSFDGDISVFVLFS